MQANNSIEHGDQMEAYGNQLKRNGDCQELLGKDAGVDNSNQGGIGFLTSVLGKECFVLRKTLKLEPGSKQNKKRQLGQTKLAS